MISKSYGGNMLRELYNLPLKNFRQNLSIAPLSRTVEATEMEISLLDVELVKNNGLTLKNLGSMPLTFELFLE